MHSREVMPSGRSIMKIKNNVRPRIELLGTFASLEKDLEEWSFKMTLILGFAGWEIGEPRSNSEFVLHLRTRKSSAESNGSLPRVIYIYIINLLLRPCIERRMIAPRVTKKDWISSRIWLKTPWLSNLWRRPVCQDCRNLSRCPRQRFELHHSYI